METLNVEQVAEKLGVVSRSVRRYIKDGQLTATKDPKLGWQIDPESLAKMGTQILSDKKNETFDSAQDGPLNDAQDRPSQDGQQDEKGGNGPPTEEDNGNGLLSEPNDRKELFDLFQQIENEPPSDNGQKNLEHVDDTQCEPIDEIRDELEAMRKTVEELKIKQAMEREPLQDKPQNTDQNKKEMRMAFWFIVGFLAWAGSGITMMEFDLEKYAMWLVFIPFLTLCVLLVIFTMVYLWRGK